MRLRFPGLFQDPHGKAGFAFGDIAASRHCRRRYQIGRQAVGFYEILAFGYRAVLGQERLGLRQRQNRIAATMHIARQGAMFQLGVQRSPRAFPVFTVGLQLE